MKPRELEKRAQTELENKGYKVSRAIPSARIINGRYIASYNDFFNAFDLIAVRDNEVRFIQITSGTKLAPHKKKVYENFPFQFSCGVSVELWYYFKLKNRWKHTTFFLKDGKWRGERL